MPEFKEKMPKTRSGLMLIVAFGFDALKFFFSTLGITGPLFTGYVADAATSHYLGSFIGHIAGILVTVASFAFGTIGFELFGELMATIVGFMGWMVMSFWFLMVGISIFNTKKSTRLVLSNIGSGMLDIIPFIDALPWTTINTFITVKTIRAEDKENRQKYEKQAQQAALARRAQQQQAIAYLTAVQQQQAAQQTQAAALQAQQQAEEQEATEHAAIVAQQAAANDPEYDFPDAYPAAA